MLYPPCFGRNIFAGTANIIDDITAGAQRNVAYWVNFHVVGLPSGSTIFQDTAECASLAKVESLLQ